MAKKANKKGAEEKKTEVKAVKKAVVEEVKKKEEVPKTILGVTIPVAPAPVQAASTEPAYVPKAFELSSRKQSSSTLGLPKSKKPWKTLSDRCPKHTKANPLSW